MAQGSSLEDLAARARLSQSTLSRIENRQRRLALDQLVTLARALDTSLDQLVETATDDVVANPTHDAAHGLMRWPIRADPGMTVVRHRMVEPPSDNPARMRAHPGREWLVVLSGTAVLLLGNRRLRVETNQAAEFPTMLPHAILAASWIWAVGPGPARSPSSRANARSPCTSRAPARRRSAATRSAACGACVAASYGPRAAPDRASDLTRGSFV